MKYILKSLQIWHLIVFQLGIEQISQIKNKTELVFFFFFFLFCRKNCVALFVFESLIVSACHIMNRAESKCNCQISLMCIKLGRKASVN